MHADPARSTHGRRSKVGRGIAAVLIATLAAAILQVVASMSPASAADWTVSLKISKTIGRAVTLTATVNQILPAGGYTLAIYDMTSGVRVKYCNSGLTPCDGSATVGYYWTGVTLVPAGSTTDVSGRPHDYVATISSDDTAFPPAGVVATSNVVTADPWTVTLTATTTQTKQVQLTAQSNYSIPATGYTLAIYDQNTGARLAFCNSGETPCLGNWVSGYYWTRATVVPSAATTELSGVPHSYVAVVAGINDTLPGDNVAATSNLVTADPWAVTLTPVMLKTKQLQLTAQANYSLPSSGYTLSIYDQTTGARLAFCNSGETPCQGNSASGYYYTKVTFVPKATTTELSQKAHDYVAVVGAKTDTYPADNVAATSAAYTAPAWSVRLSSSPASSGTAFTLTAQSGYSIPGSGYTLSIYDQTTGVRLISCNVAPTPCAGNWIDGYYTIRVAGRTEGWNDTYIAAVGDDTTDLPPSNLAAISDPLVPTPQN
jgi:hypothetical protein